MLQPQHKHATTKKEISASIEKEQSITALKHSQAETTTTQTQSIPLTTFLSSQQQAK